MSKYKTFLSRGSTYTDDQEAMVSAVEEYLETKGCEIFTVGTHNHSSRQPVEFARDLIADCDSAVVIAYERFRVESGLEKPGSPDESRIDGRKDPTVWNQLEAALAYSQRLPLLILVEKGLRRQGMTSERLEWNGLEVEITPEIVKGEPFKQMVEDWLKHVDKQKASRKRKQRDLEEITVGDFFSSMKAKHLWALLAGSGTLLASAVGLGIWIGKDLLLQAP